MYTSSIILAAGRGRRMGASINKQFIEVAHRPILSYTIEQFLNVDQIDELILVIHPLEEELMKNRVLKELDHKRKSIIHMVHGGEERYHSVYNGLGALNPASEYVLIHDGARPLIQEKTIKETVEFLKTGDGCVVGVGAKDTYKLVGEQHIIKKTLCREQLYQVQTPQGFKKHVIIEAYQNGKNKWQGITDDAMMVERFTNYHVSIIEGEYSNIKITTPEDVHFMEMYIQQQSK